MPLFIVPDTNALIHFKRADQLAWPDLAGPDKVVILLTTTLIGELDKLKYGATPRRVRDRARSLSDWVGSVLDGAPPSHGVEVRIRPSEPTTFDDDLDRTVPDDRLIATAIAIDREGSDVAILSADNNMRIKASARKIRVIRPPAAAQLREDDPQADELARVKAELQAERDRRPRLSITFPDGANTLQAGRPKVEDIPTPEEMAVILRPFEQSGPFSVRLSAMGDNPAEEVSIRWALAAQANQYFTDYLRRYAEYYPAASGTADSRSRITRFELVGRNSGNETASQVRLEATIASGGRFLQRGELASPLPAPDFPAVSPAIASLYNLQRVPRYRTPLVDYTGMMDRETYPLVDERGTSASWTRPTLPHLDRSSLGFVRLEYEPARVGRAIEIETAVISHELSKFQRATLTLLLDKAG